MITTIVLDTNVLMHMSNPESGYQGKALELADALQNSDVIIFIDHGYHEDPARNRSQIFGEYFEWVIPGSVGFAILAELAQSDRIKTASKQCDQNLRKWLVQKVYDKTDHVFVRVASNTLDRVLCSHDRKAFNEQKRKYCRLTFGITIEDADSAAQLLF